MWAYAGRRLLLAVPTLLGASIIVFAMVHLAPGDPIAAVMPAEASQAEIEATKRAYGFDKPVGASGPMVSTTLPVFWPLST